MDMCVYTNNSLLIDHENDLLHSIFQVWLKNSVNKVSAVVFLNFFPAVRKYSQWVWGSAGKSVVEKLCQSREEFEAEAALLCYAVLR